MTISEDYCRFIDFLDAQPASSFRDMVPTDDWKLVDVCSDAVVNTLNNEYHINADNFQEVTLETINTIAKRWCMGVIKGLKLSEAVMDNLLDLQVELDIINIVYRKLNLQYNEEQRYCPCGLDVISKWYNLTIGDVREQSPALSPCNVAHPHEWL
jgi:hypothetical protein